MQDDGSNANDVTGMRRAQHEANLDWNIFLLVQRTTRTLICTAFANLAYPSSFVFAIEREEKRKRQVQKPPPPPPPSVRNSLREDIASNLVCPLRLMRLDDLNLGFGQYIDSSVQPLQIWFPTKRHTTI